MGYHSEVRMTIPLTNDAPLDILQKLCNQETPEGFSKSWKNYFGNSDSYNDKSHIIQGEFPILYIHTCYKGSFYFVEEAYKWLDQFVYVREFDNRYFGVIDDEFEEEPVVISFKPFEFVRYPWDEFNEMKMEFQSTSFELARLKKDLELLESIVDKKPGETILETAIQEILTSRKILS